jgi:hypothetical protein
MSVIPAKQGINIFGYLVLAVPFVAVGYFSTHPVLRLHDENKGALLISFKHITEKEHLCTEEEKEEHREKFSHLRPHMRKSATLCGSRNRVPLYLKMTLDDAIFVEKVVPAAGFRHDGAVFLHKRAIIEPGEHTVRITMKDGRKHNGKDHYEYTRTFNLPEKKTLVVDFDREKSEFVINGLNKTTVKSPGSTGKSDNFARHTRLFKNLPETFPV